ncbi:MAG: hypothetical protein H7840_15110 [Alphaproteobacteria bacterium]
MLARMLIHGLIAAALIGSAAAVFAQTRDANALSRQIAWIWSDDRDHH